MWASLGTGGCRLQITLRPGRLLDSRGRPTGHLTQRFAIPPQRWRVGLRCPAHGDPVGVLSASISRSQSSSARCSPPGGSSRLGSSASKTARRDLALRGLAALKPGVVVSVPRGKP